MKWHSMTEDAKQLSVHYNFVILTFGDDVNLKRLVFLDQTFAIPFFFSPLAVNIRISDDYLLANTKSQAEVEHQVVVV